MIRPASRFDYEQIMDLFEDFAREGAYGAEASAVEFDREYIRQVLLHVQHIGLILVAEHEDDVVGFLMAVKTPDTWYPKYVRLQELAWYMHPNYRKTTLGGRLFKEYCRRADEMIQEGLVKEYSIVRMATSPELNLEQRGWQLKEYMYTKGAA